MNADEIRKVVEGRMAFHIREADGLVRGGWDACEGGDAEAAESALRESGEHVAVALELGGILDVIAGRSE